MSTGPTIHRVKAGDCLARIARQYGFASWRDLYHDPGNAELKLARPDPNVLAIGDKVFIPQKHTKLESAPSGDRHRFRRKQPKAKVRILVRDEFRKPLTNSPYTLVWDESIETGSLDGTLDSAGLLDVEIPLDVKHADFSVKVDGASAPVTWRLNIAEMEPIDTIVGLQARLVNLGFECGPVDGICGKRTKRAIAKYQAHAGLDETGEASQKTRDHIRKAHDDV